MTKLTDEQLAAWNQEHPVGTPLLAWPGARDEEPVHTYLDYAATRWSWDECMAWARGWGNLSLSHLERSTLDPAEHSRRYRQDVLKHNLRGGTTPLVEVTWRVEEQLETLRAAALFKTLPDAQLTWVDTLIEMALWQQVRALADSKIKDGVSLCVRREVSWPRPAALDHRQRIQHLFKPAQLPAVREELAKWLHGQPDRQPFKPEIVAEESVEGGTLIVVTFAVQDATEALRLGMNLARLEQEGGPADA